MKLVNRVPEITDSQDILRVTIGKEFAENVSARGEVVSIIDIAT